MNHREIDSISKKLQCEIQNKDRTFSNEEQEENDVQRFRGGNGLFVPQMKQGN